MTTTDNPTCAHKATNDHTGEPVSCGKQRGHDEGWHSVNSDGTGYLWGVWGR